jgi:hypothetical protein
MAGTIVADTIRADSTSTLVLRNGVANTPPTIQDSAGTQIGTFCRAWVNFNGTTNVGGFCTIRASFNVTSVADGGVGIYTVNFTNALPDANYGVANGCKNDNSRGVTLQVTGTPSTTSVELNNREYNGTAFASTDVTFGYIAIFR